MSKKRFVPLVFIALLTLVLSACSGNGNGTGGGESQATPSDPKLTAAEMTDRLLQQVEQPMLGDLDSGMVQQQYHLDPALLEDYAIRVPLMNVKTNEIAILKAKDPNDLETVQAALKQRAGDVQKQFETYLPDQYENAKNYKIDVKGSYVLFVISESADKLTQAFDAFFEAK